MRKHRGWITAIAVALIPVAIALWAIAIWKAARSRKHEISVAAQPQAPPDIERVLPMFTAALDALQHGNGPEAARRFGAFTFGNRTVEEYRLYLLSQARQMSGDSRGARRALAALWDHSPKLVGWDDIGTRLASLYFEAGDWEQASAIGASVAGRSDVPATAGASRWVVAQSAF